MVETLVPRELAGGSIEDFMTHLPRYDAAMQQRLGAAQARGKVLRYTGRITAAGSATVGLEELERTHPSPTLRSPDNVVRFAARRYCDNPLIARTRGRP